MEENEVYKRGALVILTTRFWGASKKLTADQLGDLPKEIVAATRKLFVNTGRIEHVRSILGEAKRVIDTNAIDFPVPVFKFIRKERISPVDDDLNDIHRRASAGVTAICEEFEDLKSDYRRKFPEYYNPADYPTREQLQNNFKFEWRFITLNPPDSSSIVDPIIYDREVRKVHDTMEEFQNNLISLVSSQFYSRIDKLRAQCVSGEINSGTVNSVHRVLDRFDKIWNGCFKHDKLEGLIADVKAYMSNTDGDMLRASDDLRGVFSEKLSEITSTIKLSADERIVRRLDL